MYRGTVSIDFTIGFGNNLFQYVMGRLLAEKNNLPVIHKGLPEVGIAPSIHSIDYALPTYVVGDHNYKEALFREDLVGKNVVVRGYFEDYKILKPFLKSIRGWFDKVPITNSKDVILHLRLQNRLIQENHAKNHITSQSFKDVISQFEYDKLHIVTDC